MKIEVVVPPERWFRLDVTERELSIIHSLVGACSPSLVGCDSRENVLNHMYEVMNTALGYTRCKYQLRVRADGVL